MLTNVTPVVGNIHKHHRSGDISKALAHHRQHNSMNACSAVINMHIELVWLATIDTAFRNRWW